MVRRRRIGAGKRLANSPPAVWTFDERHPVRRSAARDRREIGEMLFRFLVDVLSRLLEKRLIEVAITGLPERDR